MGVVIDPKALDQFQDILIAGGVLEAGKKVKPSDIMITEFAAKAA
jgi:hypothetical protein